MLEKHSKLSTSFRSILLALVLVLKMGSYESSVCLAFASVMLLSGPGIAEQNFEVLIFILCRDFKWNFEWLCSCTWIYSGFV